MSLKTPPRSFTSTLSGLRAPSLTIGDSAPRVAAPIEYAEWLVDGRDSDASRNMSREPGREGTEASEAWREAGLDIVGVAASGLPLWWSAASGPPRASLASMSGVSQSKLERRCVSSMSDMLGSSHFSFWTATRPS